MADAYTKAGVDITAGDQAVQKMSNAVKSTYTDGVLAGIGGFASIFQLPQGYQEPVLIAGSDGVGSKLLLAQAADQHKTIGQDLVAMIVNDILAQGAKPLFMLDYMGIDKVAPDKVAQIVSGIAMASRASKMALIGGETAELPDMYRKDEYDLAGFAVGIAEKNQILDGSRVKTGDVLLGLASSGLHSNGFSLVRKLLLTDAHKTWQDLDGDLQKELLTATRIYVRSLLPLLPTGQIHGLAHITGGGLLENLPRMFNKQLAAVINWQSWPIPAIFQRLQQTGQLSKQDMLRTFNLGIGMLAAVSPDQAQAVKAQLQKSGERVYIVGQIIDRSNDGPAVDFHGEAPW
ncbi:phosphoribosylformylglycinamidine cyclo-ligase [Oenococcus sicerae]|uniref:phosphoribosylformylglycinamidine cyclo-ligase n=1 Tax=Oenococcus sicerae TaxID=2203724 RepID=UPI0010B88907|nr:Phosphoribosylformylglycinamidine cyclo-ligase {ECO:0000255/HAMAP-Rule:MF_00741} [Oenococcus sicerae]